MISSSSVSSSSSYSSSASSSSASPTPSQPCDVDLLGTDGDFFVNGAKWNFAVTPAPPDTILEIGTCLPYEANDCVTVIQSTAGVQTLLSWSYTMDTPGYNEAYFFQFAGAVQTADASGTVDCQYTTTPPGTYHLDFANLPVGTYNTIQIPFTANSPTTTISCQVVFNDAVTASLSGFTYERVCTNVEPLERRQLAGKKRGTEFMHGTQL
ncbi:hypothetical protein SBRCBS47491_004877 [Sporothrix bragantina]|uniref:Ig-like domain-containing protein n=1 Tax=Sporothrix bragantina TaxID=671064 RepID=A0ABP0BS47_9PEZI